MTKNLKKINRLNCASDPHQNRTNSVLDSSAQYATLCCKENRSGAALNGVYTRAMSSNYLGAVDKIVIELSLLYGLRISEILSITYRDLLPGQKIFINCKKGSSNRILDGFKYYDELKSFLFSNSCISSIYSRFYFHRLFKRIGISIQIEGNNKQSVTHAGRHFQVRILSESNVNIEDTKHYISHKSIKSTQHYEKGKIKR